MSIVPKAIPVPVPVVTAQVVLNLRNGARVITQLDDASQHFWTLQVRSAPPGVLSSGIVASVSYSDHQHMYSGACKVQSLAQGGRRLVIKAPTWFKSRPLRRFERYNLVLPASVVVPQGDFCHFIPRTEASILNISEGGVLLGARQPLPGNGRRLLLLTDTSPAIGAAGGNVCFSASFVRQDGALHDSQFPHSYGLCFGHLPPLYQQSLQLMLDVVRQSTGRSNR